MSFSSSPVLQLELRRSPLQFALNSAAIFVACGIPWLIPGLSVGLSITLLAISLIFILFGLWRAGFLGARFQLHDIVWDAAGAWWLADASGRHPGKLRAESVIFRRLLWLKWDCEGSMRQAFLMSADYPAAEWRRWLARLHFEAKHSSRRTMLGLS